jgi:hypothetical protein
MPRSACLHPLRLPSPAAPARLHPLRFRPLPAPRTPCPGPVGPPPDRRIAPLGAKTAGSGPQTCNSATNPGFPIGELRVWGRKSRPGAPKGETRRWSCWGGHGRTAWALVWETWLRFRTPARGPARSRLRFRTRPEPSGPHIGLHGARNLNRDPAATLRSVRNLNRDASRRDQPRFSTV